MTVRFPTVHSFRQTRAPVSDELYAYISGELTDGMPELRGLPREAFHSYADSFLIHEQDGKFWVHAWWYSPIAYPTLEKAEAKLYPWYLEWEP